MLELNCAKQELLQTLKILSSREQKIILLRYGLGGGEKQTQKKVAEALGISRSYISRIEKRAIEKLNAAMGEGSY